MMRTMSANRVSRPLLGLAVLCLALTAGCSSQSPQPPLAQDRSEAKAMAEVSEPREFDAATEGSASDGPQVADPTMVAVSRDGVESRVEVALATQRELDDTVWKSEVLAQQFETVFVDFWDRVRNSADKLSTLSSLPFNVLHIGTAGEERRIEWQITEQSWDNTATRSLTQQALREQLDMVRALGIKVIDTEWHHSRFVPAGEGPAESTISFAIHAQSPEARFRVTGNLEILWSAAEATQQIDEVQVTDLKILQRPADGFFKHVLTADHATLRPILCYDLNSDSLADIVLPMMNALYVNKGGGEFEREKLFPVKPSLISCAQIADYDGDGQADLLSVNADGRPVLFRGTSANRFEPTPRICADVVAKSALTASSGDVDGDGDLDVWITQRGHLFKSDQMPEPYYDARNNSPAYLLENDGAGNFRDVTEQAGLAPKRGRWTYLTVFVDWDEDGDMDLVSMSDFGGLDLFENDGRGNFHDATAELVDESRFFGMGLALADFNGDRQLDIYGTGMSSTTARRLEKLGLARDHRPEDREVRQAMGYGNRMYFRDGSRFREDPTTASTVARTGWAWGASDLDFDLDGDRDVYVANGFQSGKSCRDFCTKYWTHWTYMDSTGPVKNTLLNTMMKPVWDGQESWNGYEHNALLMNREGGEFLNVGLLFDAAFVYDSRAAITEDFDGDGRPDLLVSQVNCETDEEVRTHATLRVYLNQLVTDHGWVGVNVVAGRDGRSPVGATVTVETDLATQREWLLAGDALYGQESNIAHFGLGQSQEIKSIVVRWPDGYEQRLESPAMGKYHIVRGQR